MLAFALILLAAASAFFHIRAEYRGPSYQVYLFKPLTMVLILLIAVIAGGARISAYKLAIMAGLACSLIGDVFLMLPSDRLLAGLVSFLVAHLFYIGAFTSGTGFSLSPWSLAPLVILGILIFTILSQHLGRMKLPVLVYMTVIIVMAWQAWERWDGTREQGALLAFLGAGLFIISDSALAINRFRGEFKSAQTLILGTYFAAQCLIALSVEQGPLLSNR